MAGVTSIGSFKAISADPADLVKLANSPAIVAALTSAAAIITGVAIPYSGKFTGALDASMEYRVDEDPELGAVARLGSGARDGHTVGQAAFNWYGHYDPDDNPVDPDPYPRWETHDGVKTQPSRPYEHALAELHVTYTVESDHTDMTGGQLV